MFDLKFEILHFSGFVSEEFLVMGIDMDPITDGIELGRCIKAEAICKG